VITPGKVLRLNVGFLISAPIGTSREFDFNYDKIRIGEEVVISDFIGLAKITRTPQGLFIEGNFQGSLPLECVRCLTDYQQELHWDFAELYAFTRDNITESGLLVPEDAHLELQFLVHDYALLEVPIKPICKPDCKGLCPECGENRNEVDCGHHNPDNATPFSALKDRLN